MTTTTRDISDETLAPRGRDKIEWAERAMPVLAAIRERFSRDRPLAGVRVAACLHVTAETAALVRTLRAGGADVRLCASNPLSTQDDVAASLAVHDGVAVFARAGEDRPTYFAHLAAALSHRPQLVMDDGADLATLVHTRHPALGDAIVGGTEETTSGVTRLRAMARDGALRYPVIAVNDAVAKHMFDNRYGTGQSTIDGILRATNRLLAGACFVVCGYGWCGRGLAARAAGMGARVVVTEVDPLRALEATMDGYQVLPIARAAAIGDVFCTVAGNRGVIGGPEFALMKDGAVVANAGHFDVELDLAALAALAPQRRRIRPALDEFVRPDGRRIYLLAEGRLVNLAAAEGHPAAVMDLSFADQALAVEFVLASGRELAADVHALPRALDEEVARLKLRALGVEIDVLSREQRDYLAGWRAGT
ncbi:adenosylhomocysteinase [Nannocystis exedens]|uniref:Adenosylhomocysteinase n=1 Tax=Nannocystis exedens TaxID=54 RepID=A0A1I2IMU1_9BACT|nr:adenosylhomocysteinase [Nannocystis exedens]PCC74977.1 adenosylhomocysteinase [Nannocystis exedens]SFF42938.1 adenosylhomocysteinase [Nannocystis exedens]